MTPAEQVGQKDSSDQAGTLRLEDLIPIAVVIAAGCESCAEDMVKRALQNGAARPQIKRTLGIVARLRATDCFVQAVGVEIAARMDKPLAAGARALCETDSQAEPGQCCGPAHGPVAQASRSV